MERVLIADDHPLVRDGLRTVISVAFDQCELFEASSIAEAERLEEELLAASLEPISADLTSFDPYPIDSRLLLLPEQWSNLKGVLFPVLGFTSDDSGPGTPQLASATQNVH